MEKNTRVKKLMGTRRVLVGAMIAATSVVSCTPAEKPKPTQQVIAQYLVEGKYRATASEARKKQLLANVNTVRANIRKAAKAWVQINQNTRVLSDNPAMLTKGVAAIEKIANRWEQTHKA